MMTDSDARGGAKNGMTGGSQCWTCGNMSLDIRIDGFLQYLRFPIFIWGVNFFYTNIQFISLIKI